MNKKLTSTVSLALMTATAMAATNSTGISGSIMGIYYNLLQPIAGAVAVVVLAFGGLKFMTSASDPMAKDQAKQMMMAAIVGLIIILVAPEVISAIM
ncbi:TrbC/VirB2 family protein [archaeon]